jgi:alcohol dehydrogenase class IV
LCISVDLEDTNVSSTAAALVEVRAAARISFGRDVSRFLPDAVGSLGARVLVVTGPALVAAGVSEPLVGALCGRQGTDLLVWDQGEPAIGMRRAEECAVAVRDFEPSVVVAVGGGSTMDLAKVVAARLLAASAICDWPQEGTPDRRRPGTVRRFLTRPRSKKRKERR